MRFTAKPGRAVETEGIEGQNASDDNGESKPSSEIYVQPKSRTAEVIERHSESLRFARRNRITICDIRNPFSTAAFESSMKLSLLVKQLKVHFRLAWPDFGISHLMSIFGELYRC